MSCKNLLKSAAAILLLCVSQLVMAQDRVISGRVTDSKDGTPVVGATVQAKGTSAGTATKNDGTFTLSVASNVTTLVISSVGFATQEVSIEGKTSVEVSFVSTGTNLNEVVVTGYGTARRKDLTGATASIREKDFNKGTYTSPDQLIQGKAAGVMVINNTGQPGGSTTVRIRGSSSIRSGNQPLFVVDGVPLSGGSARPGANGGEYGNDGGNPLSFINPTDIASMEILKDASATAIYGSRGANGVILITTKRGRSGAPIVDVSASVGFSNVLKKLEVLDAGEYRQALKDYSITGGDFGGDVDAWDAITRTAITQNYNVAVGGGTENARYRISAGYLNQQGVIEESRLNKLSTNISSNFRFLESKKLGLEMNLLVTQTSEKIAPISAFVGFTGNLVSQALQWNPTHPLVKPGTDSAWIDPAVGATTINPLAQLRYYDDKAKINTIIASISPSYKITNDLEYKFLYSINRQVGVRRGEINRLLNFAGTLDRGSAFIGNEEETNTQLTNTLNYNKQISTNLNLNAVAGHEWLTYESRGNGTRALDFANVGLRYYDIMHYSTQASRETFSFANPTTELQSFFARAIINYNDRFLVTGTFRADGSTKFGENNKYGYFPSVGVAWNVSKEDFMANNNFASNLKLRLGWGQTGNQEFPSGASLDRFVVAGGGQRFTQTNYGNPDLKWETSTTVNVGIDFSVFKDRLSGSVDYFNKKTTDVLFERTIAQPAPSGKIWVNLDGHVLNKGVEIMLTGNLIRSKEMNWNLGTNVTFLDNIVEGLAGFYETGALRGQGFSNVFGQRMIAGQPLNVWYLGIFEGIDKSTGLSVYTGGDPSVNKFYVGSPNPEVLLGVSTDFSYKKLTATINMNGTFGHYVFNNTAASVLGIGNLGTRNIAKDLIGGEVQEATSNAPAPSTRNLEKGNYIKMTNATISYRIGNIGKNMRNLNISLTGQNLFVITNYKGFDPEVNTDGGVDGIPSLGIEYIPYPSARTVSLGISFSL
jgi:iron complex outermembrane receptor protein